MAALLSFPIDPKYSIIMPGHLHVERARFNEEFVLRGHWLSRHVAAFEQVIQTADSIPPIPVGLQQQSMLPSAVRLAVIFRRAT
jgi:hypothetical protein